MPPGASKALEFVIIEWNDAPQIRIRFDCGSNRNAISVSGLEGGTRRDLEMV